MEWFNVFGLIYIVAIMIPNIVFAIKCKDGFDNKWKNKYVEAIEQVGRLGCFGFMIINILVLIQWDYEQVSTIDCGINIICTQSYHDFIQRCKMRFLTSYGALVGMIREQGWHGMTDMFTYEF